ncbi:MAG: hypothetical protein J5696_07765 [Lachnospiraceae bacterium]|nr:hypothetical protein [Lachnospiraceae bacterium]
MPNDRSDLHELFEETDEHAEKVDERRHRMAFMPGYLGVGSILMLLLSYLSAQVGWIAVVFYLTGMGFSIAGLRISYKNAQNGNKVKTVYETGLTVCLVMFIIYLGLTLLLLFLARMVMELMEGMFDTLKVLFNDPYSH